MKVIFALLVFTISLACSSSQKDKSNEYFEGIITFKNEYILKTGKVDSAYLKKIFGKNAKLTFKQGNYLESYDGGIFVEQIYIQNENRTYVKENQSDTLLWYACNRPGDKMLRSEINRKKEIILGIVCDELVNYYPKKTVRYYFNSDTLKIDPDWYRNFTDFNKNINASKMKAVYLKYSLEYPDFIVSTVATSITWKRIENSIFSISKNKILIEDK